jgi:hypothetical protein
MKRSPILLGGAILSAAFVWNVGPARALPQPTTQQSQSATQTFTGVISRVPSDRAPVPYVLYDENQKTNYYIDDNSKVSKYDEKRVQITGTLNPENQTIDVQSVKTLN